MVFYNMQPNCFDIWYELNIKSILVISSFLHSSYGRIYDLVKPGEHLGHFFAFDSETFMPLAKWSFEVNVLVSTKKICISFTFFKKKFFCIPCEWGIDNLQLHPHPVIPIFPLESKSFGGPSAVLHVRWVKHYPPPPQLHGPNPSPPHEAEEAIINFSPVISSYGCKL